MLCKTEWVSKTALPCMSVWISIQLTQWQWLGLPFMEWKCVLLHFSIVLPQVFHDTDSVSTVVGGEKCWLCSLHAVAVCYNLLNSVQSSCHFSQGCVWVVAYKKKIKTLKMQSVGQLFHTEMCRAKIFSIALSGPSSQSFSSQNLEFNCFSKDNTVSDHRSEIDFKCKTSHCQCRQLSSGSLLGCLWFGKL